MPYKSISADGSQRVADSPGASCEGMDPNPVGGARRSVAAVRVCRRAGRGRVGSGACGDPHGAWAGPIRGSRRAGRAAPTELPRSRLVAPGSVRRSPSPTRGRHVHPTSVGWGLCDRGLSRTPRSTDCLRRRWRPRRGSSPRIDVPTGLDPRIRRRTGGEPAAVSPCGEIRRRAPGGGDRGGLVPGARCTAPVGPASYRHLHRDRPRVPAATSAGARGRHTPRGPRQRWNRRACFACSPRSMDPHRRFRWLASSSWRRERAGRPRDSAQLATWNSARCRRDRALRARGTRD